MKTILCFGDSNTYGYIPDGSGRFPIEVRWTGRLQNALGDSARVIEEGLCGRTTIFPDEVRDGRRGIDMIGTLVESHHPVDLLVVMLGTNDCKCAYHATAEQITEGVYRVIERAKEHAPESMKVLLISPIHLGKVWETLGLIRSLTKIQKLYRKIWQNPTDVWQRTKDMRF